MKDGETGLTLSTTTREVIGSPSASVPNSGGNS